MSAEGDVVDTLGQIFDRQLLLQQDGFKVGHPAELSGDRRYIYLLNNFEAIADELAEMRAEVAWKMWAAYLDDVPHGEFLDRDAFVKEGVDLLHFLVNLFLLAGADSEEILNRYLRKAEVNQKRQDDGYDAVTGKCDQCGRALDEPGDTT